MPRLAVALLPLALVLAACRSGGEQGAIVAVGAPVPAYSTTTLAGDSASLASLRGKVVLLNIWATWCHPCREEIPVLQKLHETHAARGLELVGVSVDVGGAEAEIRSFAKDFRMTYPIWLDPAERVSSLFMAVGVPATYLVDRDGVLRWRHVGPVKEGDPALAKALEAALAGGAASGGGSPAGGP